MLSDPKKVAVAYARHLSNKIDALPLEVQADQSGDQYTHLAHLKWMCMTIMNFPEDWSETKMETKMHRWIGYIQGVLVARGLSSVDEERREYVEVKKRTLPGYDPPI